MMDVTTTIFGNVSSLLNLSIQKLANDFASHENDVTKLPMNVKSKLVNILSKRGLLNDGNITKCIHRKTKELDLNECEISDEGLRGISQLCTALRKLDLNSAKQNRKTVTNRGVQSIAQKCRMLQVLYLRRCQNVGDEAIVQVALNCRGLKCLNVGGCIRVSDDSLAALAENCVFLECLNVSSTNISDRGVFDISKGNCRATLTEFHMAQCLRITDESVEAITEYCPKIRILIFHGCPQITDSSRIALEQLLARNSEKVKQLTWTVY